LHARSQQSDHALGNICPFRGVLLPVRRAGRPRRTGCAAKTPRPVHGSTDELDRYLGVTRVSLVFATAPVAIIASPLARQREFFMRWKDRLVASRRVGLRRGMLAAGLVVVVGGIAAAADDARVMIDNFKFTPIPMSVAAGSTITWVNRDDIPHSIVVPSLGVHSNTLASNQSFAFRFDKPGTYDYICGLHPFMHGKLVVQQ
jgi:amicyanin